MKLDWQWPGVVTFSIVFVSMAALVYLGKLPSDALLTILAWLVPSPMQRKPPTPPSSAGEGTP